MALNIGRSDHLYSVRLLRCGPRRTSWLCYCLHALVHLWRCTLVCCTLVRMSALIVYLRTYVRKVIRKRFHKGGEYFDRILVSKRGHLRKLKRYRATAVWFESIPIIRGVRLTIKRKSDMQRLQHRTQLFIKSARSQRPIFNFEMCQSWEPNA